MSCKDLRLGQIVYILVFYKTSFPWLLPLDHDWTVSNLFFCCVTVKTIHIPKFRDRANWSRDTVEPIRRCAFVQQNIDQGLKNFFLQLQMEADRALLSRFCTISRKTFDVREYVLFIARNRWVVRIFQTDRRGCGFNEMACKIFDRRKLEW